MYIFTFLFLFALALLDITNGGYQHAQKRWYKVLGIIAILWLVVHDGLRWAVGTDWHEYYSYFISCLSLSNLGEQFEVGYVFLNKAIRLLTNNYTVFLLIHAIIVYLLIRSSVFKFSPLPFVSLCLFYCLMLGYLGMNRQYIAFAIMIFSYQYILDKKLLSFLIAMAVASLFHASVLIFLPAYFLKNYISSNTVFISIIAAFIVSFSGIIDSISIVFFDLFGEQTAAKLHHYYALQSSEHGESINIVNTIFALSKRMGLIILTLMLFKPNERNQPYFNFFFNLYFIALLIYIVFNGSFLQVVIGRGLMYYNIAEIFLIPFVILKFKKGFSQIVLLLLFIGYGWIMIQRGFDYYKERGKEAFRPYRSVLFDKNHETLNRK